MNITKFHNPLVIYILYQYVKYRCQSFSTSDVAKLEAFSTHKEKKITRSTLRYIGYNPMFGKYIGKYNEATSLYVSTSILVLNKAARWHIHKSRLADPDVRQKTIL